MNEERRRKGRVRSLPSDLLFALLLSFLVYFPILSNYLPLLNNSFFVSGTALLCSAAWMSLTTSRWGPIPIADPSLGSIESIPSVGFHQIAQKAKMCGRAKIFLIAKKTDEISMSASRCCSPWQYSDKPVPSGDSWFTLEAHAVVITPRVAKASKQWFTPDIKSSAVGSGPLGAGRTRRRPRTWQVSSWQLAR